MGRIDFNSAVAGRNANRADFIMTVGMLADYLRCHPSTIYRLMRNEAIPAFRVGSDWRFQKAAIDQWMNLKTEQAREIPAPHLARRTAPSR